MRWQVLWLASLSACAPDQTSFEDIHADWAAEQGASANNVSATLPSPSLNGLPGGSAEISRAEAIDCAAAISATRELIANQNTMMRRQTAPLEQAEALFRSRADKSEQGVTEGTQASVSIERKRQELVQSPSEAGQKTIDCMRVLVGVPKPGG
jgi:hypothetical protein